VKALLSCEHRLQAARRICSLPPDAVTSRTGRLLLQEAQGILSRPSGRTMHR
jgi:hypothetical protein